MRVPRHISFLGARNASRHAGATALRCAMVNARRGKRALPRPRAFARRAMIVMVPVDPVSFRQGTQK